MTALIPFGERFNICSLPFPTRPKFCDEVTARRESLYGLKESELALKGRVWKVYGMDGDEGRWRARESRTEIRRDFGKGGNWAVWRRVIRSVDQGIRHWVAR